MMEVPVESPPAIRRSRCGPPGAAAFCYGAGRDLGRVIRTHLFGITMNHAGSTFLMRAVATCRAVWSLPFEGQFALGYAGPMLGRGNLAGARKIWGSRRRWRVALTDADAYDWARIRAAWYFQARARDPRAPVFFTKSPPHLLVVEELARRFSNPRFLFLVRNPYAVCEGICRFRESRGLGLSDGSLPEMAARHAVACLDVQRRNIAAHGGRGVFFTYETMCMEPERVAAAIRRLVPELEDFDLRQRLAVGRYHEMLTDMNERHIARLTPARIAAFNRVFRPRRDLLDHFGYEMLPDC
ncbi:MAG: sulfotransferase [Acidobacteria bacterium]|nr:sulfotransferase [Acidobacteriota bacterium]